MIFFKYYKMLSLFEKSAKEIIKGLKGNIEHLNEITGYLDIINNAVDKKSLIEQVKGVKKNNETLLIKSKKILKEIEKNEELAKNNNKFFYFLYKNVLKELKSDLIKYISKNEALAEEVFKKINYNINEK
ncbi:MAG: hypothetical protein CL760_11615 [Chloroflexi bacterium]|nr:hypothetical protein [Chloroflexota bacterium]